MSVVIIVLVGVLAFLFGACLAFIFAQKTLRLVTLGTIIFENEDNVENMYMAWDVELDEILKHDVALVRIKKWSSREK